VPDFQMLIEIQCPPRLTSALTGFVLMRVLRNLRVEEDGYRTGGRGTQQVCWSGSLSFLFKIFQRLNFLMDNAPMFSVF